LISEKPALHNPISWLISSNDQEFFHGYSKMIYIHVQTRGPAGDRSPGDGFWTHSRMWCDADPHKMLWYTASRTTTGLICRYCREFCRRIDDVLCGQKTRTPHLMRISLIFVRTLTISSAKVRAAWIQASRER
jgi:hypothetical protein